MECTSQDIMLRIDSDKSVQEGKERYSSHPLEKKKRIYGRMLSSLKMLSTAFRTILVNSFHIVR